MDDKKMEQYRRILREAMELLLTSRGFPLSRFLHGHEWAVAHRQHRPILPLLAYWFRTRRWDMAGWTDLSGRVWIWRPYLRRESLLRIAALLAHEFTHVYQMRTRGIIWIALHMRQAESDADRAFNEFLSRSAKVLTR